MTEVAAWLLLNGVVLQAVQRPQSKVEAIVIIVMFMFFCLRVSSLKERYHLEPLSDQMLGGYNDVSGQENQILIDDNTDQSHIKHRGVERNEVFVDRNPQSPSLIGDGSARKSFLSIGNSMANKKRSSGSIMGEAILSVVVGHGRGQETSCLSRHAGCGSRLVAGHL
jgi:hypothetical protein